MQKVQDKMIQAYLKARAEMLALENEEDGLETVETVILVAVAVILAGAIVTILAGSGKNGDEGFIHNLFEGIKTKIGEVIGVTVN